MLQGRGPFGLGCVSPRPSRNAQRTCHQDDEEVLADAHGCFLVEAGPRRKPPLAFAGPILHERKRKPGGSSRRDSSAGKACVSFLATVISQVLMSAEESARLKSAWKN